MRRTIISTILLAGTALLAVAPAANAQSAAPAYAPSVGDPADIAALYELQAKFHAAASVRDAVNGDSPEVIDGRIRDMLALWTVDGSLNATTGGPNDGLYVGTGDPGDDATCPPVSGAVGGTRGTLCTLWKYVAGGFQPANRLISLAPAYLTHFVVDGDTATVYFQCHNFNVATDPWTIASHLVFDGTAAKVDGEWLFSHAEGPLATDVPVPGQTPVPVAMAVASSVIPNC